MNKAQALEARKTQYQNYFDEYRLLNIQKNEIELDLTKIKEKVAEMLHQDQINEEVVKLQNGENWKATYQTTTRNSPDLKLLLETVGPQQYDEIVTQKSITYLMIKKAGKEKKDNSLINTPPIGSENSFIPIGTILS